MNNKKDPEIALEMIKQKELERRRKLKASLSARKAKGLPLGRPPMPIPKKFEKVQEKYLANEITIVEACYELRINPKTFKKWLKKGEENAEKKRKKDTA